MNKFFRYNNLIYISVYILIGLDIFNRTQGDIKSLLVFMGMFFLVVINNYVRVKYFYEDKRKPFLSILFYIVLTGILIYNIGGYTGIFNYMILYELLLFTQWKHTGLLIGLTVFNTLFLDIIRYESFKAILTQEFWRENSMDFAMMLLYVIFYTFAVVAYRELRIEKLKVDKLNKQLELSYSKLTEQSEKIERLTITNERNRVAGEIHDSLGHSLIALNMNLDVAEKIIDKDIDKAKKLINKSKILTKKSMENLRRAVYSLKEDGDVTLKEKLKEIIENLQSTGIVDIELDLDEEIETVSLEYKNVIYSSIKEMITNSIKHGNAEKINIAIKLENNSIYIDFQDNGLGCNNLIKGNGLLGIEGRIGEIQGRVSYNISEGQGFIIRIVI